VLTKSPTMRVAMMVATYSAIRSALIEAGYGSEFEWQKSLRFEELTETAFLREYAWVVLCSGMRESVVRRCFPHVTSSFGGWQSAEDIARDAEMCRRRALGCFGHRGKVDAILKTAARLGAQGFATFRASLEVDPLRELRRLDYIGPITVYHLAKNIGIQVAKPDRHLARICKASGYPDVHSLCSQLSALTGDPVPVVDLVLWRFATVCPDYTKYFDPCSVA